MELAGVGAIYPTHISAFVELMLVFRQAFNGDLDTMLILAINGSGSGSPASK